MIRSGQFVVGSISNFLNNSEEAEIICQSQFKWKILIYYRSGGLKKTFFPGTDTKIKSFSFTKNERGCANGKIVFSILDFSIDINDTVLFFYNNVLFYRGVVEDEPDDEDVEIKLIPFRGNFKNFIFKNFTNYF